MSSPEVVPEPGVEVVLPSVEFFGERLALNPDVSEFAIMEFAEAAADGQDGDTMAGLASLLRLVRECIAEDDRARFTQLARKNRAGAEALTAVLTSGPGTERPTVAPSDSSDGRTSTGLKSVSSSDVKVSPLAGRPDLQLALSRTA